MMFSGISVEDGDAFYRIMMGLSRSFRTMRELLLVRIDVLLSAIRFGNVTSIVSGLTVRMDMKKASEQMDHTRDPPQISRCRNFNSSTDEDTESRTNLIRKSSPDGKRGTGSRILAVLSALMIDMVHQMAQQGLSGGGRVLASWGFIQPRSAQREHVTGYFSAINRLYGQT